MCKRRFLWNMFIIGAAVLFHLHCMSTSRYTQKEIITFPISPCNINHFTKHIHVGQGNVAVQVIVLIHALEQLITLHVLVHLVVQCIYFLFFTVTEHNTVQLQQTAEDRKLQFPQRAVWPYLIFICCIVREKAKLHLVSDVRSLSKLSTSVGTCCKV